MPAIDIKRLQAPVRDKFGLTWNYDSVLAQKKSRTSSVLPTPTVTMVYRQ